MIMLLEQNEKLLKKQKKMDDTIEIIAESINTLIEIETKRLNK